MIFFDNHLYPSLPVAALQNDRLTTSYMSNININMHFEISQAYLVLHHADITGIKYIWIYRWYSCLQGFWIEPIQLTSGLPWASASEPSSGVTNPHTGFFLFSTSDTWHKQGQNIYFFYKKEVSFKRLTLNEPGSPDAIIQPNFISPQQPQSFKRLPFGRHNFPTVMKDKHSVQLLQITLNVCLFVLRHSSFYGWEFAF